MRDALIISVLGVNTAADIEQLRTRSRFPCRPLDIHTGRIFLPAVIRPAENAVCGYRWCKGRAVLPRFAVCAGRTGGAVFPRCSCRAFDIHACRIFLSTVVRPAENAVCGYGGRKGRAVLPRFAILTVCTIRTVPSRSPGLAGLSLVAFFTSRALKRPVVDPAFCYAVKNINVIRLRCPDAVGIACHWILHGRLQHGGRRVISLHQKARARIALWALCARLTFRAAFAGFALRALCTCLALWPLLTRIAFGPLCTSFALRAAFAGFALRALRTGITLWALCTCLALRPLCACLASRTLRPHDAAKVNSAAIRQREDEPPPFRDCNRSHASGDQAANGHCDRIRNLYPHIRTSLCRRAVVPRKRCFVAVRI